MIHVVGFLCILVATVAPAAGDDAPFSVRAETRPTYKDILGLSRPNDTVFTAINVSTYHLALSIVDVALGKAASFNLCHHWAATIGGQIFEYNSRTKKCNAATLQFPICTSQTGNVAIYILPALLTAGTPTDGTTVAQLKKGVLLWSVLRQPELNYSTFRVSSPNILQYPEYFNADSATSLQTVFPNEDSTMQVLDADLLVSPVCYSNSSCGVPFLHPLRPTKYIFKSINESCGKTYPINTGETYVIFSHPKFGCEHYPDGEILNGCRINYRGTNLNLPLKINTTFLNFFSTNKCDGAYLTILAFYNSTDWDIIDECKNYTKHVVADYPRGRIDYKGTTNGTRIKLGFFITLTY